MCILNFTIYSPRLKVILKELNLSIQYFIIIYCIRIRTRRGIYGLNTTLRLKEFPRAKPEGTPEG